MTSPEGMIQLAGAIVRQAVLDGSPHSRRKAHVSPTECREAQLWVRQVLSGKPKLMTMVEEWWRNPRLPCPVQGGHQGVRVVEEEEEQEQEREDWW